MSIYSLFTGNLQSFIGYFPFYRRKFTVISSYFPSFRTEIYEHIFAIFRPHGRKYTFVNRYFPSGRLCIADLLIHSPDVETTQPKLLPLTSQTKLTLTVALNLTGLKIAIYNCKFPSLRTENSQ